MNEPYCKSIMRSLFKLKRRWAQFGCLPRHCWSEMWGWAHGVRMALCHLLKKVTQFSREQLLNKVPPSIVNSSDLLVISLRANNPFHILPDWKIHVSGPESTLFSLHSENTFSVQPSRVDRSARSCGFIVKHCPYQLFLFVLYVWLCKSHKLSIIITHR